MRPEVNIYTVVFCIVLMQTMATRIMNCYFVEFLFLVACCTVAVNFHVCCAPVNVVKIKTGLAPNATSICSVDLV